MKRNFALAVVIAATLWSQQVFADVCKALFISSPSKIVRTDEQQAAFLNVMSLSLQEQVLKAQMHLQGILAFAPGPHKVAFRAQRGFWGWEQFSGVPVKIQPVDGVNHLVIRTGPGTFDTLTVALNRLDAKSFRVIEAVQTLSKAEIQFNVNKLEAVEGLKHIVVRVKLVSGEEHSGSVERMISNYDQTPLRVVLNEDGHRQFIWTDHIVPESIQFFSASQYYR